MRHFPIFLNLDTETVILSGGGAAALAKLRLLMKTNANLIVFTAEPATEITEWARAERLTLISRQIDLGDVTGARLLYAANEDAVEDARVAELARDAGVLLNVVDNLDASGFITPAIVDRDPVTVAIGTEGAAPVLARAIKRDVEAALPSSLGRLAKLAQSFRKKADRLPMGRKRRNFWNAFFFQDGPVAMDSEAPEEVLDSLLSRHLKAATDQGHVAFVGAGPGDPELLTLKARRALDQADVVLYDRLVSAPILELARREATLIDVGKTGFGPAMAQSEINGLLVKHAGGNAHVVRLKSGDPTVFGRLDEEIDACDAAGIPSSVVPGITAASAATASLGQSLTKRGRNSEVRMITGHDVAGFADQDWQNLARPGSVAAIYMGKKAARFLQGRLLMHGASPTTPITIVENASRPDQRIIASTLAQLPFDLTNGGLQGPAVMMLGLSPRAVAQTQIPVAEELA